MEVRRGMGRVLIGIIMGIIIAPLLVLAWFRWGNPPVAVVDHPFPLERQITHIPLNLRIRRDMPKTSLVELNETNLIAGAQIYRDDCASCHGFYGKPSVFAAQMYPKAPQLWEKHMNGSVVGVSDDPPGETYWKVANGIRLTGMPAYQKVLTATQIWQVTQLLANADKPLPPQALQTVKDEQIQANTQPTAIPSPSRTHK